MDRNVELVGAAAKEYLGITINDSDTSEDSLDLAYSEELEKEEKVKIRFTVREFIDDLRQENLEKLSLLLGKQIDLDTVLKACDLEKLNEELKKPIRWKLYKKKVIPIPKSITVNLVEYDIETIFQILNKRKYLRKDLTKMDLKKLNTFQELSLAYKNGYSTPLSVKDVILDVNEEVLKNLSKRFGKDFDKDTALSFDEMIIFIYFLSREKAFKDKIIGNKTSEDSLNLAYSEELEKEKKVKIGFTVRESIDDLRQENLEKLSLLLGKQIDLDTVLKACDLEKLNEELKKPIRCKLYKKKVIPIPKSITVNLVKYDIETIFQILNKRKYLRKDLTRVDLKKLNTFQELSLAYKNGYSTPLSVKDVILDVNKEVLINLSKRFGKDFDKDTALSFDEMIIFIYFLSKEKAFKDKIIGNKETVELKTKMSNSKGKMSAPKQINDDESKCHVTISQHHSSSESTHVENPNHSLPLDDNTTCETKKSCDCVMCFKKISNNTISNVKNQNKTLSGKSKKAKIRRNITESVVCNSSIKSQLGQYDCFVRVQLLAQNIVNPPVATHNDSGKFSDDSLLQENVIEILDETHLETGKKALGSSQETNTNMSKSIPPLRFSPNRLKLGPIKSKDIRQFFLPLGKSSARKPIQKENNLSPQNQNEKHKLKK